MTGTELWRCKCNCYAFDDDDYERTLASLEYAMLLKELSK